MHVLLTAPALALVSSVAVSGDYDIVDAHTHFHPTAADAAAFRVSLGRSLPLVGDLDDARAYMARYGVRKLVLLPLVAARRDYDARLTALGADADDPLAQERIRSEIADAWSGYNRWAAELARDEPERFTAAVAVDPLLLGEEWAREEIERGLASGARAIKVMPAWIGVPPWHGCMRPVWELADRHGVPVVSMSGLTPYSDVAHPDNFEPVATSHPRVRIILAHMGMGAEDRTVAVTASCPNVFVDTSAWFNVWADPESWLNREPGASPRTPEQVADWFRAIGVERILFGTNNAIQYPALVHESIRATPLTDAERRRIFSGNYSRVFAD